MPVNDKGVRAGWWRGGGAGGGGRRAEGAAPPVSEFLTFFGQNADDSGKSTREKTF